MNGPSEERASTEIIVGDGNLDGIEVFRTKAVTATGRVIVDPVASPLVRSGSIEVFATPAHPAGVPFAGAISQVLLNEDLTFELKAWPGRMRLMRDEHTGRLDHAIGSPSKRRRDRQRDRGQAR